MKEHVASKRHKRNLKSVVIFSRPTEKVDALKRRGVKRKQARRESKKVKRKEGKKRKLEGASEEQIKKKKELFQAKKMRRLARKAKLTE